MLCYLCIKGLFGIGLAEEEKCGMGPAKVPCPKTCANISGHCAVAFMVFLGIFTIVDSCTEMNSSGPAVAVATAIPMYLFVTHPLSLAVAWKVQDCYSDKGNPAIELE